VPQLQLQLGSSPNLLYNDDDDDDDDVMMAAVFVVCRHTHTALNCRSLSDSDVTPAG